MTKTESDWALNSTHFLMGIDCALMGFLVPIISGYIYIRVLGDVKNRTIHNNKVREYDLRIKIAIKNTNKHCERVLLSIGFTSSCWG